MPETHPGVSSSQQFRSFRLHLVEFDRLRLNLTPQSFQLLRQSQIHKSWC